MRHGIPRHPTSVGNAVNVPTITCEANAQIFPVSRLGESTVMSDTSNEPDQSMPHMGVNDSSANELHAMPLQATESLGRPRQVAQVWLGGTAVVLGLVTLSFPTRFWVADPFEMAALFHIEKIRLFYPPSGVWETLQVAHALLNLLLGLVLIIVGGLILARKLNLLFLAAIVALNFEASLLALAVETSQRDFEKLPFYFWLQRDWGIDSPPLGFQIDLFLRNLMIPVLAIVIGVLGIAFRKPQTATNSPHFGALLAPMPVATWQSPAMPGMSTPASGLAPWMLRIPGQPDTPADLHSLQMWARQGFLRADTHVVETSTGYVYLAWQIPGVFSEKTS